MAGITAKVAGLELVVDEAPATKAKNGGLTEEAHHQEHSRAFGIGPETAGGVPDVTGRVPDVLAPVVN